MNENNELFPKGRTIGTKRDYARHRNCAPSAVTRALKEGRISTITINGRAMIDFAHADASWAVSTRPKSDAPGPPPPRGPFQAPDQAEAVSDLAAARLKKEQSAAELLAMRIDKEAGLLVERADVDWVMHDLGASLRSMLQELPAQLAGELVGQTQDCIRSRLDEATARVLTDLSDRMARFAADAAASTSAD